jgi:hypothetical protein
LSLQVERNDNDKEKDRIDWRRSKVQELAENDTKATHDINYLKNTIVKIADSYKGITSNTSLNQFGDRKYGDYDFWAVRNSESTHDSFIWKRIGKYVPNIRTEQELVNQIMLAR